MQLTSLEMDPTLFLRQVCCNSGPTPVSNVTVTIYNHLSEVEEFKGRCKNFRLLKSNYTVPDKKKIPYYATQKG